MNEPITLDINGVMKHLPHRYPFLLVDRVLEFVPGKSIRALKNVTFNEPYFTGHFPAPPADAGRASSSRRWRRLPGCWHSSPPMSSRMRTPASISSASTRRASASRSSRAIS